MATNLKMKIRKIKSRKISIEIGREDFETFCNACGLFKKEFLDLLDASEKDHQEGRITERDSLKDTAELRFIGHHNKIYDYPLFFE